MPAERGTITAEIDGEKHNLVGKTTEEIVDLGIALVPEGRRLFPRLPWRKICCSARSAKSAREQLKQNLDFCLTTFPRLAERKNQLAGSMSGGEQQMLALARALMLAPKILLIDEPSVGLSPLLVSRTIDTIRELKTRYQLTVLMAEQNFNQAIRIADLGYVIVHGKIAFERQVGGIAQQQRPDPEVLSGPLTCGRHFVASPPSTMMVSTSPAPLRRNAAASSYSFDWNRRHPARSRKSITTKRWNLSGPSMI